MSEGLDKLIPVCDKCLTASCWYGEFMCDLADSAGLVMATRRELMAMNRESPSYWTDAKLEAVHGTSDLSGMNEPRYIEAIAAREGNDDE